MKPEPIPHSEMFLEQLRTMLAHDKRAAIEAMIDILRSENVIAKIEASTDTPAAMLQNHPGFRKHVERELTEYITRSIYEKGALKFIENTVERDPSLRNVSTSLLLIPFPTKDVP